MRVADCIARCGVVAAPGIFDTLSARLAERAGAPLAIVSGYSVAATAIGEPDLGLLTQTELVDRARAICAAVSIPVLVDADTGYGNPLNVHRTVRQLIAAGAAGCFLEDQVWPKRCGHLAGKKIIDRQEYLEKIRAASDARGSGDFFIVARSDALAVAGLEEAIVRVEAARDAGADASFVEAPTTMEQLTAIGRRCRGPNVANMILGGKTPLLPTAQLAALGFHLVLYPLVGLFAAARAMQAAFAALVPAANAGGAPAFSSAADLSRPMSFEEFGEIVGLDDRLALAQKYEAQSPSAASEANPPGRSPLPLTGPGE